MSVMVLERITRDLRRRSLTALRDEELLDLYCHSRDEDAFATLVRRHGPLVLGVCRGLLRHEHDAEDAFQVAFLVLARKAETLERRELLGNWLYGTAYRAAQEVRARRRQREQPTHPIPDRTAPSAGDDSLRTILAGEINRLPDRFRASVVLCDLQGVSRKEAAERLGIPEGTLSSRLATARRKLAERLTRHGLALTAGTIALFLTPSRASAHVSSSLQAITVGNALAPPAALQVLMKGVMHTMLTGKIKLALAATLLLGLAGTMIGWTPGEKALAASANAVLDKKDKTEVGPTVRGTLVSVDADKRTFVVRVSVEPGTKKTEDKTYTAAADAKVVLEDVIAKKVPLPLGTLKDLSEGTYVSLQLSADSKSVVLISARGPGLHCHVKSVDAKKGTVTVESKGKDGPIEQTLNIVKGAKVILDDGIGKKGDPPTEGKLADLTEGVRVIIQLTVDRKSALGISIHGQTLFGQLKGYDAGNRSLTITVKEDGGLVDKTFKLAKDARIDGELTAGAGVNVRLSVKDKESAVGVHVRKD